MNDDMLWRASDLREFAAAYLASSAHAVMAKMAAEEYQRQGRGLIAVTIRGPRISSDQIEARHMQLGYRPLAQFVRMTLPLLQTKSRNMIERTILSIDEYDPATQMVIAFVAGPQFLTTYVVVGLAAWTGLQPKWVM